MVPDQLAPDHARVKRRPAAPIRNIHDVGEFAVRCRARCLTTWLHGMRNGSFDAYCAAARVPRSVSL
jgi:hypothetical protein